MNFFSLKKKVFLSEISSIKKSFSKIPRHSFSSFSEFGTRKKNTLSFFDKKNYNNRLYKNLDAVILTNDFSKKILKRYFPKSKIIIVKNPRAIFIKIINDSLKKNLINPSNNLPSKQTVSPKANIGHNVIIEPNVQIDENTYIGCGSIIKSGTWIKKNSVILENTVIGVEGINNPVKLNNINLTFPHIAGVIIEEGVRIGSNCVIVKGILKNTVIGKNTIIGNFCNIGHSVTLEDNLWISGSVIVGGFTLVGKKTNIGMGSIIKNSLKIGKNSNIGMGSVVIKSTKNNSSVFGNPAKNVIYLNSGPN